MGEFVLDDVCEQILIRLDAEDLIRCKSVCKSWKSLISHPRFLKAHHKRQVNLIPYRMGIIPNYLSKYGPKYYMVGSSNGLACISSFDGDEIIVANPWTREERMLQKPPVSRRRSCWGFGYDALTDDFKVVCGVMEDFEKTTFHVFSLKSNFWKHVGHVNYKCFGVVQIGTFCNGVLHWVMFSSNPLNQGLISFDLSKEVFVFKEIHQPDYSLRGIEKYNVKLYWPNYDKHYAFIPTTVMPSLISPYLQERNE